eukprot:TRINITY_DN75247_c0_g1_i1.p1 TRINITY_DN75247_c0_g1~~TRINITY_DN75247_c0_g1_i1.p1  ORF type:complete len:516 (-),score=93.38 TRINITY_DN75247_c0_g1_i1:52-1395(-)
MTGISRGFAYVNFESAAHANAVLAVPHEINGKQIDCKAPQPKAGKGGCGCKGFDGGWGCKGGGDWSQCGMGGGWDAWGGGWDGWGGAGWNGGGQAYPASYGKGGDAWGGGGGKGKAAGPPQHDFHPRKVFAGALPKELTDESVITNYFSQFGILEKVEMKIDPMTGNSRGFCFVTFANDEGCQACIAARETHSLGGKWIDVKTASPNGGQGISSPVAGSAAAKGGGKDKPAEPCKVFVGGLRDVTEEDMVKFFSQFGPLKSCELKKDPTTGQPRGFGFVLFADEAHAASACANSANNYIKDKWVEVRPAGTGSSKGQGKSSDGYGACGYGCGGGGGYGGGYGCGYSGGCGGGGCGGCGSCGGGWGGYGMGCGYGGKGCFGGPKGFGAGCGKGFVATGQKGKKSTDPSAGFGSPMPGMGGASDMGSMMGGNMPLPVGRISGGNRFQPY